MFRLLGILGGEERRERERERFSKIPKSQHVESGGEEGKREGEEERETKGVGETERERLREEHFFLPDTKLSPGKTNKTPTEQFSFGD